jgi:uncharacterized protein YbjT (DUF2867 family)
MTVQRVFIVGGTGNIGKRVVQDLLAKDIPVTLYARQPDKVRALFGDLVQTVQGDFSDLSPLQAGIQGHTRLFLLVADFSQFVKTKRTIAEYAYAAGVEQVVDVSSFGVNIGWRTSAIGVHHYLAEQAIFDIPDRKYFVALRAGRFMSNHFDMAAPIRDNGLFDTHEADLKQGWISTEDIGAVAAVVLSDSADKHGDAVYNLNGEALNSTERAAILSRVVGKEIKYQQVSVTAKYDAIMQSGHFSHVLAVDLIDNMGNFPYDVVTPVIEILLRRKPQTLEEYLTLNKSSIN